MTRQTEAEQNNPRSGIPSARSAFDGRVEDDEDDPSDTESEPTDYDRHSPAIGSDASMAITSFNSRPSPVSRSHDSEEEFGLDTEDEDEWKQRIGWQKKVCHVVACSVVLIFRPYRRMAWLKPA